jgi:hypothetical protein
MEEHFKKFISRIGFYKTSIFQIDTHLKEFIRFRKDNLPKDLSEDFIMPILGSKLIYRNVLTAKYEFGYTSLIDIENIEEKVTEIIEHYCNYCISQCFEAFESFLKDILCQYFLDNKKFIEENEALRKINLNIDRFENCRKEIYKLLKTDNAYNKQLFKWFYKIDNGIKKYERENFLRFDFYEWNIVFTEMRHSITHSNANFSKTMAIQWTDFQKRLLNELFVKSENGNIIIISTFQNYDYITKIIAQHGQLIYDRVRTA